MSIAFADNRVVLGFVPAFEVPGFPNLLTDIFFSAVSSALQELIGSALIGPRLELAYHPGIPEKRYSRLVGMPTTYGHPTSRLVGPAEAMDMALPGGNVATADIYLRQCELLLQKMEETGGYQASVRRILLTSRTEFPGAEEVAVKLGLSVRTLRRRLAEEETSFQTIVNDVRSHLAREYLRDTAISVAEIGILLGYDDLANFRSAFKRWTGMTPSAYRQIAKQE